MSRALIFANGELNSQVPASIDYLPDDWIIAADGGARHCMGLGLVPMVVIGDFDSLSLAEITYLEAENVQLIRYPVQKDETDLELAIQHAIHLGAEEICIFGALGARWDMTLANLMLLTHPAFQSTRIQIVDGNQEINLLRGGDCLDVHGRRGDLISLIPISSVAVGITTENLEYHLQAETLTLGSPRGVSNVMLTDHCQITLGAGLLAVALLHQE
jgi:thiamine pyrophosphokinase